MDWTDTVLLARVKAIEPIEERPSMEKIDKSEKKIALVAISSKLRDILRSHADGKRTLREMAERIQARKEARDNATLA